MKSLHKKFLLFTIVTMIGSTIISFLIVNTYYHQFVKKENDEKNMVILKNITAYIEQQKELSLHQFLTMQANTGYKLYLVAENKNYLHTRTFGEDFKKHNLSEQKIYSVLSGEDFHGMRNFPRETFVTGFFADELANSVGTTFTHDGKVYALFLRPNIKLLFSEVHILLGGLFGGIACLSLIAMLLFSRTFTRHIRTLTEATKQIRSGTYDFPLPIERRDEIGILATNFKSMARQLAVTDRQQRQFISDVSHDFQTPLQHMKGYATLLQSETLLTKERITYASIIEEEAIRLSHLADQLLFLNSLDGKQASHPFTYFRLDKQWNQLLHRFRWRLEKHHLSISTNFNPITFYGKEDYLERAWENILDNAITYSKKGGQISIAIKAESDFVQITIEDQGIGVSDEQLPFIFDRFYRGDRTRHSESKGTGLGLAIVKQIIQLHKGKIDVISTLGKGTTFTFQLPKRNNFNKTSLE